jgi:hypothetical protein
VLAVAGLSLESYLLLESAALSFTSTLPIHFRGLVLQHRIIFVFPKKMASTQILDTCFNKYTYFIP